VKKGTMGLCLAAIFFLGIAGRAEAQQDADTAAMQRVPVKVIRAVKRDLSLKLPVMGTIQYVSKVDISSEIPGLLSSVRVEEGDVVKKGQLIATVDQTLLKTQLKQAQAVEEMAEIDLKKSEYEIRKAGFQMKAAKVTMDKQADKVASQKRLFKIGAITRSDLDAAMIDDEKARADYQEALADYGALQAESKAGRREAGVRVEKARADAKEIEAKLRKCRITSPIAGIVAEKRKWTGEYVGGGDAVIVTIIETGSVYAEVDVNERDVRLLEGGEDATVVADAYPGRTFHGRVSLISPVVTMSSRTLKVRIKVDNEQLLLKPGMFARATIFINRFKDAVTVPTAALMKTGDGRPAVFVALQGVAFLRTVEIGLEKDNLVVIQKGVKPGELVVVEGQKRLRDLSPVKVVEMRR
jgi:multidrug efflux pump subunit AcrA (membrane-fusion protein)